MAFERIKEEHQEREATEAGPVKPPLSEVLTRGKNSHLFGMVLERDGGDPGLAERFLTEKDPAKFNEEDLKRIREATPVLLDALDRAKQLKERLGKERIEKLAMHSAGFREFVGMVGAKTLDEIFERALPSVAIENPERFDQVLEAMERIADAEKKRDENLDTQAEIFARNASEFGVSRQKAEAILSEQDDDKRRDGLRRLVAGRLGWKKLFINAGELEKRADDLNTRQDIINTLDSVNKHLENFGEFFAPELNKNSEFRAELIMGVRGEKPLRNEDYLSYTEARRVLPGEDEVRKGFEAYQKEKNISDWSALSPNEQEKHREEFAGQFLESNRSGKKHGFWRQVLGKCIKKIVENIL